MVEFTKALQERAWYPLFAYAFTALIALWRKARPGWFEVVNGEEPLINPRFQWIPALLVVGMSAFVEAFASGLSWMVACGLGLFALVTSGPAVIGGWRIVKETKGEGGATSKASSLTLLFVCGGIGLGGCSVVKPVVKTVDDVAKDLCAIHYGEEFGVSFDEAARKYCELRKDWAPFIDPLVRARLEAAQTIAAEKDRE